jgi:hypothetical protein
LARFILVDKCHSSFLFARIDFDANCVASASRLPNRVSASETIQVIEPN